MRHRLYKKVYTPRSPLSIVSMVWSGGIDWLKSKARIVALASAIPSSIANFSPWTSIMPATPTIAQTSSVPGTVVLSIGGSNGGGDSSFAAMAGDGVDAWFNYFTNMFKTTGLNGIDWDLEGISPTNSVVYNFVGQLSSKLKATGALITFTIFGNKDNMYFPPLNFITTYLDACTYIVFMLYNGGMWVDSASLYEDSWCTYVDTALAVLPAAVQSKFLYALYPKAAGKIPCCAPCVQQAVDNIRAGKGAGIAFWCQGGYLGGCTAGTSIIAAWIDILNQGGGNGVEDFQVAYPDCTGTKDGTTAYNGCGYNYECVNNACTQKVGGSYQTSDCGGACSGPATPMFSCNTDTGLCGQDPSGTYSQQSTCQEHCAAVTYSCKNGSCSADPNGTQTKAECLANCPSPTPQKYLCKNGTCQLDVNGTFEQKSDCDPTCPSPPPPVNNTSYSCNNGTCQQDINGKYAQLSDCQAACPQQFNCFAGYCQPGYPGAYSSMAECQSSCSRPTYYSCSSSTCQADPNGYFMSSDCGGACATNPDSNQLYSCVSGQCQPTLSTSGVPKSTCQGNCSSSPTLYNCVSGQCTKSTNGTGQNYTTCQKNCSSSPTLYTCVSGQCKVSATGKDLTTCQKTCKAPPSNNNLYSCSAKRSSLAKRPSLNKKKECVVM